MSSTLEMPPVMAQQKGWIDFPPAPERISDLGIAEDLANDLALKLASTVPQFDTKWGAERLQIPIQLAEKLFWKLKQDRLLEVLSQEGPFCYRYACTCLLYTSPSPRDRTRSRMPSSA